MANLVRLSDAEIRSQCASLPGWELREGALHRELTFRDFVEAFTLMTRVAFMAERIGHHPEWSNVYNRVTIRLTTHDVGGVSENDLTMAREISCLYQGIITEAMP
jgi:4a-hydroxytetrahydrobiopterin dehydratase